MIKHTFIVIMILLFAMGYASGQTTHRIIMDEVEVLHDKSIDRVIVFGNTCGDCNADIPSSLYFLFQDGEGFKCKVLKYERSGTVSTLVLDSTYLLASGNVVEKYVSDNYDSIINQFKHSFELLTQKKNEGNGIIRIITPINIGPYCHLGLYIKCEYYFINMSVVYDDNYLFEKAFESWVLFSFLKNQFPNVMNYLQVYK